jgi:serine/threonine-protein kinase ATR
MKLALKMIPTYVWLSAMPQIISRVCHDNPSVKLLLSTLIQKMFRYYPHQCMWFAMGVLRARHRDQAKRDMKEIVEKAISGRDDVQVVLL